MADAQARIVISAKDDTGGAIARARAGFQSLQGSAERISTSFIAVNAALAGVLGGVGLTTFIKNTIDGLDALTDLRDATGASIENISALEDVAARTGTTFDSVGQALVKFNSVLKDAKPGSDQAVVLKAIGLSAERLRELDPAEALRQTAVQLGRFADDGNKARIVQELFGKSIREVAPFLKDLAESGELNAKVTTEQAEAAEKFNKQLDSLAKNSKDVARSFVSDLVPALNSFLERAVRAGGVMALIGNGFKSGIEQINLQKLNDQIVDLTNEAVKLQRELDFSNKKGLTPNRDTVSRLEEVRAELLKLQTESVKAGERLRGLLNVASPIKTPEGLKDTRAIPLGSAPGIPDNNKAKSAALTAEQIARLQVQAEEDAAKEASEAWSFYDKQRLAEAEERGDAEKLMWKQVFEFIDSEQQREIDAAAEYLKEIPKQTNAFAEEARRNIQDALGDTISDTLKGDFDNIEKLWGDLLIRMASQAVAAQLNKYLFGDGKSDVGVLGPILSAILPSFDVGTPYVPRDMVAVVHKGEAIVPAAQNKPGAGGGGNFTFNVASGVTRPEVLAALKGVRDQMRAEMRIALARGA